MKFSKTSILPLFLLIVFTEQNTLSQPVTVMVQKNNEIKSKQLSGYYASTRGKKQYELTNHLDNVIVTISDRKIQTSYLISSSSGITADLISASDYYAFGMTMPERKFEPEKYKFGFNGQLKSDEVNGGGNLNTALYWEYDTRIGRRWNIDPENKKISWESPYMTMGGNPIRNNDVLGNVWDPTLWEENSWLDKFLFGTEYKHFRDKAGMTKAATYSTILLKTNSFFASACSDIRKSNEVYTLDEVVYTSKGHENGSSKGTSIKLTQNQFTKGTVFEEVFHAGQYENYNVKKSLVAPSTTLSLEVEAKVARSLSGVDDPLNMSDAQKTIMNKYYKTLKSGETISSDLRIEVNATLNEFASYLVNNGGYGHLSGELKNFQPEETLKYFEKITTSNASTSNKNTK